MRDEWGFKGFVITDSNLYRHMQKQPLYGGIGGQLTYAAMTGGFPDTKSDTAVSAVREASRLLLFACEIGNYDRSVMTV